MNLDWRYAKQIDEWRVIMVTARSTECKMITWDSEGGSEITEREPRAKTTKYPAVCNDGTKWFVSIAGYTTYVERHDIENNTWEELPPINVYRCSAAAVVLNHVIYVFCGEGS